jgi:hypothetical protein
MSVVKFLCPNGHQLTAPENLIGKPGKCPKCSAAFVIPAPHEEEEPATVPASGSGKQLAGKSGLQLPIQGGSGSRQNRADLFVFLCPNGHKLNGPTSLKGKLGQCPHCGARFHIPSDEELEEAPPNAIEGAEMVEEAPPDTEEVVDVEETFEPEPPFDEAIHPLAHIMYRLWLHKGDAGEVEIFLPEGEIMHPDYYSAELSQKEFGVFATREGTTFSFSVIPWGNVRRIAVHKAGRLPPTFGEA